MLLELVTVASSPIRLCLKISLTPRDPPTSSAASPELDVQAHGTERRHMVRNFGLHDADVTRAEHTHAPPRVKLHLPRGNHDPTPAVGLRAMLFAQRGWQRLFRKARRTLVLSSIKRQANRIALRTRSSPTAALATAACVACADRVRMPTRRPIPSRHPNEIRRSSCPWALLR